MAKKAMALALEDLPEISFVEACNALVRSRGNYPGTIDPDRSRYASDVHEWELRNDRGYLIARVGYELGEVVVF